jgi:hypothetical protein
VSTLQAMLTIRKLDEIVKSFLKKASPAGLYVLNA